MIVVADASVLVAELLRARGRALFARLDLHVVVAEEQWSETQHELQRRLAIIIEQGRLTVEQARKLQEAVQTLVDNRVIEVIPHTLYAPHEAVARRRVPRDPHDWPPVALALALDAGILTGDQDSWAAGARPGPLRPSARSWTSPDEELLDDAPAADENWLASKADHRSFGSPGTALGERHGAGIIVLASGCRRSQPNVTGQSCPGGAQERCMTVTRRASPQVSAVPTPAQPAG